LNLTVSIIVGKFSNVRCGPLLKLAGDAGNLLARGKFRLIANDLI
jgi:hypothetical protein